MSDNAGTNPVLLTEEEFTTEMGNVSPDSIFMTALSMLLHQRGGTFTYSQRQLNQFRGLYGQEGQLGITVSADTVTVFLFTEPVVHA